MRSISSRAIRADLLNGFPLRFCGAGVFFILMGGAQIGAFGMRIKQKGE
jgi:hypothetical protein